MCVRKPGSGRADDSVKEGLLRFMALVLVDEVPDRDRRGGTRRKTIRPIGRGGTGAMRVMWDERHVALRGEVSAAQCALTAADEV